MKQQSIAILVLRVMLGISFLTHGISKFQGGIDQTAAWFDSIGIPGAMAYIVAVVEIVGGLMMIFGIAVKYVGPAFVVVMLGAIFTVKKDFGFLGNDNGSGYELELVLAVISLFFVLIPKEFAKIRSKS
ncbi:DoxX family protein [Kurthia huakuii]|uniref:DoxX family protein n=1 Tax=Kurthia huakuii TaxID=1421019 RepID=UPI000496A03E|nr:DoxX family protein [Kurthia huakuii]MBM7701155.1 putative membrane protein YphA (DoxX/SURF4 family) [Kurthia huakuii]